MKHFVNGSIFWSRETFSKTVSILDPATTASYRLYSDVTILKNTVVYQDNRSIEKIYY